MPKKSRLEKECFLCPRQGVSSRLPSLELME